MNHNNALKFALDAIVNNKSLPQAFRDGVAAEGERRLAAAIDKGIAGGEPQYTGKLIESLTETVKQAEDYPRESCDHWHWSEADC